MENLTIEKVSQVYVGKDKCCRCGCGGKYTATSFMKNNRSEVNDKYVERQIKRAKTLLEKGEAKMERGSNNINISFGNDRAITFYLDELK